LISNCFEVFGIAYTNHLLSLPTSKSLPMTKSDRTLAGAIASFPVVLKPTFRTLKCHTQVLTLQAFESKGSKPW
jgi:hypothetical protein